MHRPLIPLALAGLLSCGGDAGPPSVPAEKGESIALSALELAELELPPSSRPGGAEPPARIPLDGPWKYAGPARDGLHKWSMDVPIRPRSLFFHNPQPGMAVFDAAGNEVAYDRASSDRPQWEYNRKKLVLHLPEKGDGPGAGAYTFAYPRAVERERALNLSMSGAAEPAEFAWTTIQDDWDSRSGLLLPAPGVAAWDLEVPPAGELLMHPGIVEPEVLVGAASDGARLVVEVDTPEGATEVLWTGDLKPAAFEPVRVDLSKWAGQKIRLRLRSEAAGNTDYDYVFAGDPIVASRTANPQRVVLVFVDTLRPDHLGMYGYERETSPALDAWAEKAAVFEQARSVAPWTLPSARTVITGRHPEYYEATDTLQRRLADEGWATAMLAGNVYLSANFDMNRDWGLHRVGLFPSAEEVTNDALAYLDAHEGRDLLLQVHYMDPHLPYLEPKAYRYLFAGDAQGGLGEEFHLPDVRRAKVRDKKVAQYIVDRYDNNIRYANDQIARILERLDDNDIVVFYSDHGEEFWDHGGFEHGHTLFDELLRVPLVIDGPGLEGARIDAPVSLLDITPTVLELVGLEADGLEGRSLLAAARGEEPALEALRGRDLAFGRPLYGVERWGVLTDNKKWTTAEGREALYDLGADPAEQNNLIANKSGEHGAPYHANATEALGVPMEVGYRLTATNNRGGRPEHDTVAVMRVPGGVKHAWVSNDPLMNSSAEVRVEGEDLVVATWHAGFYGSRDIYVVPNLPIEEVTHDLEVQVKMGDEGGTFTVDPRKDAGLGQHRVPLGRQVLSSRAVALTFIIAPFFGDDAKGVTADDPEVTQMLQAMGYQVGDDEPGGGAPEGGEPEGGAEGHGAE